MTTKPSSLLDDADFSAIGKSKGEREKAKEGSGNGNGVKIAVVIACFAVAGLGLAWNFGLFETKQLPSTVPGNPSALTEAEKEAAAKQEQRSKEVLEQPGTTSAGG